MNKIKNFFSKYWLFILLAFIATIIACLYFFSHLPQKENFTASQKTNLLLIPKPEISYYPINVPPTFSPELQKKISSLKNQLEVYQVSTYFLSNSEVSAIAKNLGFSNQPTTSTDQNGATSYIWSEGDKFLLINIKDGKIDFGSTYLSGGIPSLGISVSFSEAENTAKNFLGKNSFLPPAGIELKNINTSYVYVWETGSKKVQTPQEANAIQIDFGYEINKKVVINLYTSIIVNNKLQTESFSHQLKFKEVKNLDIYPLKTFSEISQQVKAENSISYLQIPDYYAAEIQEAKNIINLNYNDIQILYFNNFSSQNYLQPVYLLTGTAQLKNNQSAVVGLYLPAIKEEYLLGH